MVPRGTTAPVSGSVTLMVHPGRTRPALPGGSWSEWSAGDAVTRVNVSVMP